MSPDAEVAGDAVIAPGAVIHAGARIGAGTRVGANTVIHRGVQIGERCVIEDCVVLGKQPRLRAASSAPREDPGPLVLEEAVTVCCGAVVYAGTAIGARTIIGDQAQVRERSAVGSDSVVGRGSSVDFNARVGSRVLIQTGVYVTGGAVVEDDVFLGPGVFTTNDNTMDRHGPSHALAGPVFRRACRVGSRSVLAPGVEIGEEAFVAAGSVVIRDVPRRGVVMGVPAKVVREVPDEDLLERWR